ncbi:substrate-binding domain-containing protein [Ruminococcus sp. OA3]|uniref:substrate-binding domain-containing protein n=1 Tax=Ruminococcus sp. OA3 TaxID=2914164 RepID=UPI001F0622BB|nr:substrate-binding domain-containing protein [Ruminococcus sp. OA3]MCH1984330.1 substrate-binding domain-containing protein [Ruminococcus sp. OA3]
MKRRVIAGILVGLLAIGTLAGCGGKDDSSSNTAKEDTASDEGGSDDADAADDSADAGDSEVGNITMIMALRDEFLSTLEAGAIAAADEMGINLTTQDAQSDTSKLLQFVETARNDGQKAIIVNPVDPETCPQIVEAAGDMKVVFVNRPPVDTEAVLNENVVYVGSDEMMSGKYQGDFLSEKFKAEGKDSIKYILLNGTIGNVSTTQRTASCLQAFEDNGIKAEEATAPLAADFDRATAQDMITPLLTTIEYDCIIANNDAMALGAIEALKDQGIDPTTVPVVGIDATVDGRQAVKDGTLAMTVFQDANGQGYGALKAAANLVSGTALNEGTDYELDETGNIMWVPFEPVTPDNVADYD